MSDQKDSRRPVVVASVLMAVILLLGVGVPWWFWGQNLYLITGRTDEAPHTTSFIGNAVGVEAGGVLLIRTSNNDYCAIRFDRMTNDVGADYSAWFIPSAALSKRFIPSKRFEGHVFERYWRTRRTWNSNYPIRDIGGVYAIRCGPLTFEWSTATWVYLPDGYSACVVRDKPVGQIDLLDESLQWRTSPFD